MNFVISLANFFVEFFISRAKLFQLNVDESLEVALQMNARVN